MKHERALILGGGGLTGTGWLLGILAGLADNGVDLRNSDHVVGTSCGAIVGTQLAWGADPRFLYDRITTAPVGHARLLTSQAMAELGGLIGSNQNLTLARARVGQAALGAESLAPEEELRATIAAMCPFPGWPDQRLTVTAVDAETGEFTPLDRESGFGLTDAVVASCSLPFVYPPTRVNGRRWIDGFIRSPANVDIAAKSERIVVLAPMAEGFSPIGNVPDQVREVRDQTGATIALVCADESVAAVNPNPMDPAHLPAVAAAGRAQAARHTQEILSAWG